MIKYIYDLGATYMGKEFSITHKTGEIQKGLFWAAEEPKANLVMATGMQEYAKRYDDLANFLNKNGYNVYCLDSFGQGLNAATVEELQKWPVNGFAKNVDGINMVVELAKKNKLPTHIFGHSMGSFMIQSYLEKYPGSAGKTIICGSNGPALILYAVASLLAKVIVNKKNWDLPSPFLSNLGTGAFAKAIKNRKTDLDWLSFDEKNVNDYIKDPYCGHPNTGGFWRGFLEGMNTVYRKKNLERISKDEDIFIIAGEFDPVGNMGKGPISLEKMYRKQGVKNVSLKIYENMRHEIHNEKDKEKVYKDILNFLDN